MKKILFSLLLVVITAMGFAQGNGGGNGGGGNGGGGCPTITGGIVTGIGVIGGVNQYVLYLEYDANGTKHFNVIVRSGGVVIIDTCIQVQGPGSFSFTFAAAPGPQVEITSGTGGCNNSNSNSCSQFPPVTELPPPTGGPLPIIIENFFAKRSSGTVYLTWRTSSEVNAKEFILQKNTGAGFVDVKTIPASNLANGASYTTTDVNNSKSTTFYRLKLVDQDASFRNSDTRTVKGLSTAADYTVFPNPSVRGGKVSITDISEPTDVQVIDNAGRVVKNIALINTNTIDLNNLQNGMYQLRIKPRSEGAAVTRKLSIVN